MENNSGVILQHRQYEEKLAECEYLFSIHSQEYKLVVEPAKRSKGVQSIWRMNQQMLNFSIDSQASQKVHSQAQLAE